MLRKMCIVLLPLFFVAADKPKDTKSLQGVWNCVALEGGGIKMTQSEAQATLVAVNDDAFLMKHSKGLLWGKIKVDSNTMPMSFELTAKFEVGEKEGVALGIYEHKDGVLKFIWNEPGKPRPTEFKTAGSLMSMLSLKLVPTNKPLPPIDNKDAANLPIQKDESPKQAMLRQSKVYEKLDLTAILGLYDYSGAGAEKFARSDSKYAAAVARIQLAIRNKFGQSAEDTAMHMIDQPTDEDIQQSEFKTENEKCTVKFPFNQEPTDFLVRVKGIWKVDGAELIQGMSEMEITERIKDIEKFVAKVLPLAEKVEKGQCTSAEEAIFELTRHYEQFNTRVEK